MAPVIEWMSKVKKEMKNSPLATNSCFGLILLGLEKIVEIEFSCPCNPTWNPWIVSSFFVAPAVIVFLLMCSIQGIKCKQFPYKAVMHSAFPGILWVILLFIDGQYYACAKTSWPGKYEVLDNPPFQRWCNPSNSTQNSLTDTQRWYSHSQLIGISMALGLACLYSGCLLVIYFCCEKNTKETTTDDTELENFVPKLDEIVRKLDDIVLKLDNLSR
ncbi:uncharacterized protein LOC121647378 isoform X2 [Melanotaenia boesemani]|uniref:uncharacterized protein LOC121647378 isoform X2 n=1 Tax=Melanotaenia boesemani TaxID=1250792 RepID=UPI001C048EE4|nr:uncharacterized protein LOC121647378 isoform X2 [Melanotaenia boesemani]XP_041852671.1 uncharacterized protein LOC121647378 isoform X2 [Melanotaenia boesemani]